MQVILQNKARLKSLLAGYERNSTVIIAQGLVSSRARRMILKDLRMELQKYVKLCRLTAAETHALWNSTYKTLARASKACWGKRNSTDIYRALKKQLIYSKEFTRIKNSVANRHEEVAKHDYIHGLLDERESPFYLSDSHKHCSKGHLAYENKLYYDEDYSTRYGLDSETIKLIGEYIKSHELMSVQEVTGEGVWLITRPNCGHRLYPVPVNDVLHGKKLRRILSDDYRTRTGMYEFYYERGRMLESLRDVIPCSELEKDYSETLRLIKKNREL